MLTITTNKTEIKGIADRSIRERTLPITDFWTKRIGNLLGAADSDRKEIMHNLTEGRPGTTDTEREVTFTAGGAAAVRVKVTIRIGQQSGVDCFILTIRDVLEVRGSAEGGTDSGAGTGYHGEHRRGGCRVKERARSPYHGKGDGVLSVLQSGADHRRAAGECAGGSERTGDK